MAGYRVPVNLLSSAFYSDSGLKPPHDKIRESLMVTTVRGKLRQVFGNSQEGAVSFFSTPSLT
ncbi:MAG: hypothetical protein AB7O65_15085, partial [Candidatus Korobacteraceae bacterium]